MNPLLMVHGILSNARKTFGCPNRFSTSPRAGSMMACLIEHGYAPGRDVFWYTYSTLNPITCSARRLQAEIERVQAQTGCRQVDVLTFSLGGIVGKYYAVSPLYRDNIGKLIMIAPPFLGSRWANGFPGNFHRSETDLMFSGDGRALSPQFLSQENQFLRELARTPLPMGIQSVVIAMNAQPGEGNNPISNYVRWLTGWLGEGDLVVPVRSTCVSVDRIYQLQETFSRRTIHKHLPDHPEVQALVIKELRK